MPRGTKTTIISVIGATLISTSAMAGGFSRGTADTDILFEDGQIVSRAGVTYVSPQREFETVGGAPADLTPFGGVYSDSYVVPSAAFKLQVSEMLSCAGTAAQAYGGNSSYAAILPTTTSLGNQGQDFTIMEYGGTCALGFDTGMGRFSLIGGGFVEVVDFEQIVDLGGNLLTLDSSAGGYRVGVAYEKKEIALRVQAMYRSGTTHEPDGMYLAFPVTASAEFPQSFEIKAQSGIAPGWLAFGSVKWTDWSVFDTLSVTVGPAPTDTLDYYWQDGWTVTGGIGHAFTDKVSGAASVTWDRGVSTGLDLYTDTWTFAGGITVNDSLGGELRLGGAVSILTSGEQSTVAGAAYDATVGNDLLYAVSAGYKLSF